MQNGNKVPYGLFQEKVARVLFSIRSRINRVWERMHKYVSEMKFHLAEKLFSLWQKWVNRETQLICKYL